MYSKEEQIYLSQINDPIKLQSAKTDIAKSHENWNKVMTSPAGQEVLWSIISMCGPLNTTIDQGHASDFLEGKRSIGLDLIAHMVAVNPKLWLNMQYEFSLKMIDNGDKLNG